MVSRTQKDGYLKKCNGCGHQIYMKRDHDDQWRPYESWKAETVDEGEWKSHECSARPAVVLQPVAVRPVPPPPTRTPLQRVMKEITDKYGLSPDVAMEIARKVREAQHG
jgi:hypothetical protein